MEHETYRSLVDIYDNNTVPKDKTTIHCNKS